ncbi:MAG TPA: archease [Dehalococcoidales bacterium]|nr:archease [Dehalococcoidales bacterium]
MKKGYEVLPHTADIGITAWGKDMAEVFVNTARGLFSIIADIDKIRANFEIPLSVTAPDRESLLVNWLNELNFIAQTKFLVFSDFKIQNISDTSIEATALGEKINPHAHYLKREIKAVTYHHLKIAKTAEGWQAQVIFDI